jgi:tetratricopeptide (TPR) repeat protein
MAGLRITGAHVIVAVIGLSLQFLLTISVRDVVALQTGLGGAVRAIAGTGGRAMEVHWIRVEDTDGDGTLTWREVASSVAKEVAAALRLVSNQHQADGPGSAQRRGRTRAVSDAAPVEGPTPQKAVEILQSSLARRDFVRAYKAWSRLLTAADSSAEADELRQQTAASWISELSTVLESAGPNSRLSGEEVSDACQSLAIFARTPAAEAALLSALRREIAPAESALSELWSRSGAKRADGMLKRGTAQMATGKHGLALRTFDGLVEAAPYFPEAWNRRAALKYAIGDYVGSLRDCGRALELSPSHFGALSNAGLVHIALWQARQPQLGGEEEGSMAQFRVGAWGEQGSWGVDERGEEVGGWQGGEGVSGYAVGGGFKETTEDERAAWSTEEQEAGNGEREELAGRAAYDTVGVESEYDEAEVEGEAREEWDDSSEAGIETGMRGHTVDSALELEKALHYFHRALAVHPKMEGAYDSARATRALLGEMGVVGTAV